MQRVFAVPVNVNNAAKRTTKHEVNLNASRGTRIASMCPGCRLHLHVHQHGRGKGEGRGCQEVTYYYSTLDDGTTCNLQHRLRGGDRVDAGTGLCWVTFDLEGVECDLRVWYEY